jgi:transcription elongation factor/antiterminator RfaH
VFADNASWYIVKTGKRKEALVQKCLSAFVEEIFVPMLQTKRAQWGKVTDGIVPLFPCYIFARFQLARAHYRVAHSPGVVRIVGLGDDPSKVEASVIEKIRSRMIDGVVVLTARVFREGQAVNIVQGPLRGIDGVFHRYLSGSERVAILLETVHGTMRAVVPVGQISPLAS